MSNQSLHNTHVSDWLTHSLTTLLKIEWLKPTKPNLPNQTYSNEPTKPNLPNHAYQTEPTKPNLPNYAYQTMPTKTNRPNQTY